MERIGFYAERWFDWRAPESAARYLLRQAIQSFAAMTIIIAIVAGSIGLTTGWDQTTWQSARPAVALLLFVPVAQFLLGMLYFKLRDAMFGAFASPKSLSRVLAIEVLIALVVLAIAVGSIAISTWDQTRTIALFPASCAAAVFAAIGYLLLARLRGPTEISDATWALITIAEPAG